MSQGSFSSSLFHAENWCVNQSRRGDESYQSLPVALQCENPNFSRYANLSRGAHQPPQQLSVFQNQNSGWYGSVQNQSGFLVATSSFPSSGENRQSRFVKKSDQNQMVQQEGIYLASPNMSQLAQSQMGGRTQTVVYPNNPLISQNRAPSRGAQAQPNLNFGVQEQGEFVEYRVLPRGAQAQQTMSFGVEGQCGPGENRASSAQSSFYGYMETPESLVSMQFNPNVQQQVQFQAFALPQPSQYGYVPQQWPNQQTAQVAQMEMEMELQQVKLSGQCAKLLKELPILNGTEDREVVTKFFTTMETRTAGWSTEKIMEVMQIKAKGKFLKAVTAALTRFGTSLSLKVLRTEIMKVLYGEESLEKGLQQDSEVDSVNDYRSRETIEEGVWGDHFEGQNHQIVDQKNFFFNLSNGAFGREIYAPKKSPLNFSFSTQEISEFVKVEGVKVSPISPIQMGFSENLSPDTHRLKVSSRSARLNGSFAVAKMPWHMEVNRAAKNVESGGCKGMLGDQKPQLEKKGLEKAEDSLKRADQEKIRALEKQLKVVSKERDNLKNLVESLIEGKELNRKARKAVAHKFRKVYPVEKTEKKAVTTGKTDLAKKAAESSEPKIVEKPPELLVPQPARGRSPFPNSVKVQQKEPERFDRSKAFETGRRKEFMRVFVNSALKKAQSAPNSLKTHPKQKNSEFSNKNNRKRENFVQNQGNLHRGVRVFVNSRYKRQSERSDPPSPAPIDPQKLCCLNKTPQIHSTCKSQVEAQSQSVLPPPQSNFQGLQPTCSTGQHQQVDEDATLDGDGGGRTDRR